MFALIGDYVTGRVNDEVVAREKTMKELSKDEENRSRE